MNFFIKSHRLFLDFCYFTFVFRTSWIYWQLCLRSQREQKTNRKPLNLQCVFESANVTSSKLYISLIARWCFSVLPYLWFWCTFTSIKEIMQSSVIILWNGVLILNWKKNKKPGAICFKIRISREKNKELLRKSP